MTTFFTAVQNVRLWHLTDVPSAAALNVCFER